MHAIRDDPALLPDWQGFLAREHRDFDRLYPGFASAVDLPTATLWRDLALHWTEAKVILTVRDPEKWYDSVTATVLDLSGERDRIDNPHHRAVLDFSDAWVGQGMFQGRGADRDYMLARVREHVAEVQAALPPERLLVFQVTDGWKPLCDFLGVPVPDRPFPDANAAGSYRDQWD